MPTTDASVVVIVGPTAVGKTAVSLSIASGFYGEVINADASAFYRGMDIGTAKPTFVERSQVPHHLFDIADPNETITVGQYQSLAYAAVREILDRGALPVLVGGSSLYIKAVTEGYHLPSVPPQEELRRSLIDEAERYGKQAIHQKLQKIDPVAAASIDFRNLRRVIRAIEVTKATGTPFSVQQIRTPPPYRFVTIGLFRPREELYQRIDLRIEMMLKQGFVQEVRNLIEAGYAPELPSMAAIGYRQIADVLAEKISLDTAIADMRRLTRRLVRQQGNWFRLTDPRVFWIHLGHPEAYHRIQEYLFSVGVFPRTLRQHKKAGNE